MKEISRGVFDIALAGKEPIKELLDVARRHIEKAEIGELHDIDLMLSDRYIEYLRRGTIDDLEAFAAAVLSFVDSSIGDALKATVEGRRFFDRWDHYHDLCEIAIESYDPELLGRFIQARSHGPELMRVLKDNDKGIRFKALAQSLGITEQYLAKLLREFEGHDLVIREKRNKVSTVKLGFAGRAYVTQYPTAPVEIQRVAEAEKAAEFRSPSEAVCDPNDTNFENPFSGHSLRDMLMGCTN